MTPVERFTNEPLTDFSRSQNQEDMRQALRDVQERFGEDYALVINGKELYDNEEGIGHDPNGHVKPIYIYTKAHKHHIDESLSCAKKHEKE